MAGMKTTTHFRAVLAWVQALLAWVWKRCGGIRGPVEDGTHPASEPPGSKTPLLGTSSPSSCSCCDLEEIVVVDRWEIGTDVEAQPEESQETSLPHLQFGAHLDQNNKRRMEDMVVFQGGALPAMALMDGHGGLRTVQYVTRSILDFVKSAQGTIGDRMREAFKRCEADLADMYSKDDDMSGTTAVVAVLHESTLWFGNIGDSRGVVCRNERGAQITSDHKGTSEPEKTRILATGGSVDGEGYVGGELAVSRALGDHHLCNLKSPSGNGAVSSLPDIFEIDVDTGLEFALLGCDGIFDVMSTELAAQIVRKSLEQTPDVNTAARALVERAIEYGSHDNLSTVIMVFKELPLPPRTGAQRPRHSMLFRRAPLACDTDPKPNNEAISG